MRTPFKDLNDTRTRVVHYYVTDVAAIVLLIGQRFHTRQLSSLQKFQ
jgi:hypothetical protein